MTLKTVSWVAPDLNEWPNPQKQGTITYYVNVVFSDDDRGSIGKENRAKAEELKALLEGLLDKEADFGLKDSGKKTDDGGTKWNLLSFPGYEPEPFLGGGGGGAKKEYVPRYQDTQKGFAELQRHMDRRTALMQAVAVGTGQVLPLAEKFYAWLSLAPASSAAARADELEAEALSPAAGANSSAGAALIPDPSGDPSEGEGDQGKDPTPSEHVHTWKQSPTMKSFEVCSCGATRRKATA